MTRFGEIFKVLGNFCGVIYYLAKFLDLLLQILLAIGKIFVDVNGQMLKNNQAIWSHWQETRQQQQSFLFYK